MDNFKEVFVLKDLINSPIAKEIISSCPSAEIYLVDNQLPQTVLASSRVLTASKTAGQKIRQGKQLLLIGKGSIVGRFEGADKRIKCPSFERLNPSLNCPFNCSWCFLVGTHRTLRPYLSLKINYEDHLRELEVVTSSRKNFFVYGELQDGTALEPASGFLHTFIPYFGAKQYAKLLVLTKAVEIAGLIELSHQGHTIFSCSLQASPYDQVFEKGAPSTECRLAKMKVMGEHGYPLRVRIDPMVLMPGWSGHYSSLVKKIFNTISPERITLGVPRFEPPTKALVKKMLQETDPKNPLLEQIDILEYQLPEAIINGKKSRGKLTYSEDIRIAMYSFMIREIRRYSDIPIALCKETESVWSAVGLDLSKVQCNCVEDSVNLNLGSEGESYE
jgi:spore photoproduct lyase